MAELEKMRKDFREAHGSANKAELKRFRDNVEHMRVLFAERQKIAKGLVQLSSEELELCDLVKQAYTDNRALQTYCAGILDAHERGEPIRAEAERQAKIRAEELKAAAEAAAASTPAA